MSASLKVDVKESQRFEAESNCVTAMMPHPERVFRTAIHSWSPAGWGEDAPWMRLFRNARKWEDWRENPVALYSTELYL